MAAFPAAQTCDVTYALEISCGDSVMAEGVSFCVSIKAYSGRCWSMNVPNLLSSVLVETHCEVGVIPNILLA